VTNSVLYSFPNFGVQRQSRRTVSGKAAVLFLNRFSEGKGDGDKQMPVMYP